MSKDKIKETLAKQLALLSERSEKTKSALVQIKLSEAMLKISEFLLIY